MWVLMSLLSGGQPCLGSVFARDFVKYSVFSASAFVSVGEFCVSFMGFL